MTSKPKSNQIPEEILKDPVLNQRIAQYLPENYNFEIYKTIWRIRKDCAKRICLQFPDGLFIFATSIVDVLREFCPESEFIIMSDVTYGACCIDDVKTKELNCDMIIHYGHSCLVPINRTLNNVSILYVFVDIRFDLLHFIGTIAKNFNPKEHKICLASTIQFVSSLHMAVQELKQNHSFEVFVPRSQPLTPGEILGCTAPKIEANQANTIIFVADGRFHLEALMIANPDLPAYRYDPYSKDLTREYYEFDKMISLRTEAIKKATECLRQNQVVGIVIGTLGRQGSMRIFEALKSLLSKSSSQSMIMGFFIAEISPKLLEEIGKDLVKVWIQIGCPRLSIDWGADFIPSREIPILSPFEFRTAIRNLDEKDSELNDLKISKQYPMDFYATKSLGNWTPNHRCHDHCQCQS
ncbi:Bardet-Biedl syndrome 1 protein-like [Sarcoptes scabiei]|nr:Bardet-Biedl syndrome 1 protein-like [Sarcoptes scabiei]